MASSKPDASPLVQVVKGLAADWDVITKAASGARYAVAAGNGITITGSPDVIADFFAQLGALDGPDAPAG